jgi:hypothetical protein
MDATLAVQLIPKTAAPVVQKVPATIQSAAVVSLNPGVAADMAALEATAQMI